MRCDGCARWVTERRNVYGDGAEITIATFAPGRCDLLGINTLADFGCTSFREGYGRIEMIYKVGSPWHHFVMIDCPDCSGHGSGSGERATGCNRCAGTGKVRRYDDGFIGEEQTRLHPKEVELGAAAKPKCRECGKQIEVDWKACPFCAARLTPVAQTEFIDGEFGGGNVDGMGGRPSLPTLEDVRKTLGDQNEKLWKTGAGFE